MWKCWFKQEIVETVTVFGVHEDNPHFFSNIFSSREPWSSAYGTYTLIYYHYTTKVCGGLPKKKSTEKSRGPHGQDCPIVSEWGHSKCRYLPLQKKKEKVSEVKNPVVKFDHQNYLRLLKFHTLKKGGQCLVFHMGTRTQHQRRAY